MMIETTTKSILAAALSAMLLAGPTAVQQTCSMDGCCCHPEETVENSFERGACCQCGTMEQAPLPVQPASETAVSETDNIRPKIDLEFAKTYEIFTAFDHIVDSIESDSLSPPFIESRVNAPLIC